LVTVTERFVVNRAAAAVGPGRFSPTVSMWFQIFLSRHEQFDKWLKQARGGAAGGRGGEVAWEFRCRSTATEYYIY
jgi:hypothetical protein